MYSNSIKCKRQYPLYITKQVALVRYKTFETNNIFHILKFNNATIIVSNVKNKGGSG